ncbi:MAG TPA: UbiA family prenyltransferase [Anaerolineae bacterium]|nr:UbiA family prenyltransferase [Anaerolineae bacterium]
MISRLFAYLKTMRLIICMFASIMALEGYWLAVHRFEVFSLAPIFAAIAAGSGLAFANVLNDILDLEADRVNHPRRALPAGKITPSEAGWLAGVLCGVSLLSSWLAGGQMFPLALGLIALSVVYNLWAKKIPILGNFIVALSGALILATGSFIVPSGDFPIFPLLATLAFLLAREFLETVSDAPGDQLMGRISVATLWGKARVLQISFGLALVSVVLLVAPAVWLRSAEARLLYLLTIASISILPGFIFFIAIWKDQSLRNIHRVIYRTRLVLFSSLISLLWLV